MLCKHFFAIFKSSKAKFDDLTKHFLNHPCMLMDKQLLMKISTNMQKNYNTLGKTDTTNKISDNIEGNHDEMFQLNEDRSSKLPFKNH